MAEGAISALGGIAGGLLWQILGGFGILVVSIGLFYGIRWIQKGTKKQKSFNINVLILDLNGVMEFDMLAFTKSEESGLLEMIFKERKSDSIPPIPKHLIRNGWATLLNYAPGHYCVIDLAQTIWNISSGNPKIIPFNLGMKKYITAKQREIMNKAEAKKKKWETYAPWYTLGGAVAVAVLLVAFVFFVGARMEASFIAQRIAECTT